MQLLARSSAQNYDQDCTGSSINAPPPRSSAFSSMLGFYFHCCSCSWSWEQNCWCYLSFPLAGVQVQAAGSRGSSVPLSDSSAPAGQLNISSLEQQCLHFLAEGLAPSTQQAYASSQRKFLEFCHQAGKLHSNGLPCPADKWTLCLFVSFLAYLIQHSSKLKVYLSAVHSSHIEQGFSDPLLNCPWLQRMLSGVKRSQGSSAAQHLPVHRQPSLGYSSGTGPQEFW